MRIKRAALCHGLDVGAESEFRIWSGHYLIDQKVFGSGFLHVVSVTNLAIAAVIRQAVVIGIASLAIGATTAVTAAVYAGLMMVVIAILHAVIAGGEIGAYAFTCAIGDFALVFGTGAGFVVCRGPDFRYGTAFQIHAALWHTDAVVTSGTGRAVHGLDAFLAIFASAAVAAAVLVALVAVNDIVLAIILVAVGEETAVATISGCRNGHGILAFDGIPVRVGSGAGAVGYLFDRVSGTLFSNAGTGAFTYGNDLKYPIPAE